MTCRTRFAPSPSGDLHVGGARTALFCWALARKHDGAFLLRIEDTDQKRSSDAASLGFLRDLRWLGIGWDEGPEDEGFGGGDHGPYFQSQRLSVYQEHLQRLIDAGMAYPAFETGEELTAARNQARAEKRPYRYDRAALQLDPEDVQQRLDRGDDHVIRFRVPDDSEVIIQDEVLGEVRIAPGEVDDFVIRKADGFPTYHFAVVVDDASMGVSHVVRGQEHLANTPRHVLLQQALGFDRPVYAHLPLIQNPDGSKMSKRDKDKALRKEIKDRGLTSAESVDSESWEAWLSDKTRQLPHECAERLAQELGIDLPEVSVDDFRRAGYLPEVLINYLALLGWSAGDDLEKFDGAFLCENFTLDRIGKSNARFDRQKLLAFNLDAIQAMTPEEFLARFRDHCEAEHSEFIEKTTPEQFALIAESNRERAKTLDDPARSCRFFVMDDEDITWPVTKGTRKALAKGEPSGFSRLQDLSVVLSAIESFTASNIEAALQAWADAHAEGNFGAAGMPLRVAVTGGTTSPPLPDTLAILGKASVLRRIERCVASAPDFAS